MTNKKSINPVRSSPIKRGATSNGVKWDIKRGYSVYQSVYTEILRKWIKEGKINEGEVLVWTSGMSGWRRPEELEEFRNVFEKKKKKKKKTEVPVVLVERKRKRPDVVIIDDEADLCWLLGKDLRKRHFNVSSSNSGRDGLELVKKEEPDIVLLDLKLKDVDGLNVLCKIKELWPKVKVIIISAFGGPLVKEKAISLGADYFVDKPFKTEDIVKAIRAVI